MMPLNVNSAGTATLLVPWVNTLDLRDDSFQQPTSS